MSMNKEEILNYLKEHKVELRNKFGVVKIGLFGSYSIGADTEESDIDICVVLDKKYKKLRNYLELERWLSKAFGKKVDLGIEDTIKPIVKKQIEKEIIYV